MPPSAADRQTYCSRACSNPNTEYRPCARCGTIFRVAQAGHTHCSEACRRPAIMLDCVMCEKPFRICPWQQGATRFCSVRCYRRHTGETVPEGNVRRSLETLGVPYEQEAVVQGWHGPVDFLLGGPTAIEVDEPYWHAKTAARDAKKTLHMQGLGWLVIRLVATPFYGAFKPVMVDIVRSALAVAEHSVPTSDVLGLYPLQLALPFDQEGMIGGSRHPKRLGLNRHQRSRVNAAQKFADPLPLPSVREDQVADTDVFDR